MNLKYKISSEDISAFSLEMAMLLKSGIPIGYGIRIIINEEHSKNGKDILNKISYNLDEGLSLYESLKSVEVFPDYMISMVLLGEKTGTLEKVFNGLYRYYKKESELKDLMKKSLVYPCMMLIILFIVISILTTKVLPIFENVFLQLGSQMPKTAITIMNIGNFLYNIAFYVIIILIVMAVLIFLISKNNKGIEILEKIKNSIIINSKIYEAISISRFTEILYMTMSVGYDMFDALDLGMKLSSNTKIKERIHNCIGLIENGVSFSEALEKAGLIKQLEASMLSIGFQTGSVEKVIDEICQKYTKTAEDKINNVISSIEPIIVIVLSVLVGIILLSVMMPLWGIMSSIG